MWNEYLDVQDFHVRPNIINVYELALGYIEFLSKPQE